MAGGRLQRNPLWALKAAAQLNVASSFWSNLIEIVAQVAGEPIGMASGVLQSVFIMSPC